MDGRTLRYQLRYGPIRRLYDGRTLALPLGHEPVGQNLLSILPQSFPGGVESVEAEIGDGHHHTVFIGSSQTESDQEVDDPVVSTECPSTKLTSYTLFTMSRTTDRLRPCSLAAIRALVKSLMLHP